MMMRASLASSHTRVHRRVVWLTGALYGGWWFSVHWLLPDAFNPPVSRAMTVALCFAVALSSYVSTTVQKYLHVLAPLCAMAVTTHYYYLFYYNSADINWVVGSYITLTAAGATLLSAPALLSYSAWVLVLSAGLTAARPALRTVFFPGVLTILTAAYVALRLRFRLLTQLRQSAQRITELYQTAQASEQARIQIAAAQEAQRVREEYVMILAHELKTPLTAIKLRTQMMQRSLSAGTPPDADKVNRFVHNNNRQADRLAVLLEEMLDVSRIRAGKLAMQHERLDLSALVEDTVRSFEDSIDSTMRLTMQVHPAVCVDADRFRIEQVLLNLLTNAVKYGGGTPVHVVLSHTATHALLTVRDLGQGIAPQDQERVFLRFERAVSARDITGLGLGLYICREIVAAHQGTIGVQSTPGRGALFTVSLPLAGDDDADATSRPVPHEVPIP